MRNFSLRLARRLNAHLTESANENELRFGIENLLIQMILVLCMSLIAGLFHVFGPMLLFMLSLVGVRSFTGGIHLRQFHQCVILTNILCFGSLALCASFTSPVFYGLLEGLAVLAIWRWAPDMRYKRRKTEQDRRRARNISRILSTALALLSLLEMGMINQGPGRILACSLAATAVSLALAQRTAS